MTAREIVRARLNHKGTDITPYTVEFEAKLYQKLTEYYKDENWESKKLRKYMTHFSVDTVKMEPVDDVYSKDGYGALWRMDQVPWHLETPTLANPDFEGIDFPKAERFVSAILQTKQEGIRMFNADNEHYRLIDMGWGIFEHSWRMRGFENALVDMLADEDFYSELTQKITDIYIAMLQACEDIPADAFVFGDDWGEQRGIIMGADTWRKFIKPCWAKIYTEVHRQGKLALHHSCGSIAEIYGDLIEIGMDCHESVQPEAANMAPELLKKKWGDRMSFWGCLGTQSILFFGSPCEIKAEVLRLHNLFKRDGGYLLAPTKPLQDEMPIENAIAVVEAFSELSNV